MTRIFGKAFGESAAALEQARALELSGELAKAATLFAQAGRPDEAARVMILRGDKEVHLATRLRHYAQAVATAAERSSVRVHARRMRCSTILAMAANTPMTAAMRRRLADAAAELVALGDHVRAAEAFARLGDTAARATALAFAGEVDALEALLSEEQGRDNDAIARRDIQGQVALLVASGQRRQAVALASASADPSLRERARSIELRRVARSLITVELRGEEMTVALGDEIVIGRTPEQANPNVRTGILTVASRAVSRRHLAITRSNGHAVVRDLGSRNETTCGGRALSGETPVGSGIELRLGLDVTLVVRPSGEIAGAVTIEVACASCIAPLGPALLAVGAWRLERGDDGWVELRTDDDPPAYAGAVRLARDITLLEGDAFAADRGGRTVFKVSKRER
ncbi:MAG: FHA domain-containing protein [Myxococcota bacterium]|nr:FHA domain-containing protein [Myxococcota bacterium]